MVPHVHFLALLSWLFQKPGWALASSQAGDGYVQEINLPRLGRKGPSAGRLLGWWREREEPLSLAGAGLAPEVGAQPQGHSSVWKNQKKLLKICQNCAHPSVIWRWQRPVSKALHRQFRSGREAGVKCHRKEESPIPCQECGGDAGSAARGHTWAGEN